MGAEYLYSHNTQIFDGFALGRYIFGSATGFLHYATPAVPGMALAFHRLLRQRQLPIRCQLTVGRQ